MVEVGVDRRLAGILAADIAGFRLLMGSGKGYSRPLAGRGSVGHFLSYYDVRPIQVGGG